VDFSYIKLLTGSLPLLLEVGLFQKPVGFSGLPSQNIGFETASFKRRRTLFYQRGSKILSA
jgi:hypothetical protein